MSSDGLAKRGGGAAGVVVALLASEGAYLRLARFDAVNGWRPVGEFLTLFAWLFLWYAVGHAAARRAGRTALAWTAAGAVLFRLTLLPAGLPPDGHVLTDLRADLRGERVAYERFLLFDSDLWRYLWEGHVGAHGLNPFSHAPEAEALDALGSAEPGPLTDQRAIWGDVRDNVNHPRVSSIYPPLAQFVFRLAHFLAPGSVLALKAIVVLFDLAAAGLLALALRACGRPPSDVLLYAWNPLVVKAFAGSGHVDALLVAGLAATTYALLRQARLAAAAAFAVAVLAKPSPLVLLPLVARRVGARGLLLMLGIGVAAYAPFVAAGPGLVAGLRAFAGGWEFNAGPFALVRALLGPLVADADAGARLSCAALAGAVALWLAAGDDGRPASFAARALWSMGALLLLSPAVMPWYVTWLLPFAVVSGQHAWLAFSGLAGLAFLVMVDGRERGAVLALEYGLFAAVLLVANRDRLRAVRVLGGTKMKSIKLAGFVALLLASSAAAWAQGSGSTAPERPGASGPVVPDDNFTTVRQLDGTLASVDEREGVITLDEKQSGRRLTFRVDSRTKLKAEKNTSLGSRRDLTLADFKPGQTVRIAFRTADRVVVELKLRKGPPAA